MSKITVQKKQEQWIITNRLTTPEAVNERVVSALSSGAYPGFLSVSVTKKRNKTTLSCTVREMMPLKEYFSMNISGSAFLDVAVKITHLIKTCDENKLNDVNLDLQKDRLFINPSKRTIMCIYWPIVNNMKGSSKQDFLRQLPYDINFTQAEDTSFLKHYSTFFSDYSIPFSLKQFERLLLRLQGRESDMHRTPLDEMLEKLSPITTEKDPSHDAAGIEYDPLSEVSSSQNHENHIEEDPIYNNLLSDSSNCNTDDRQKPIVPKLIDKKTGEAFPINKPVFVIGRGSNSCDLSIVDSRYVSRIHAMIITMDNRWFIYDKQSVNKTYVNDKFIPAQIEIELQNETKLRFGDKEYFFVI